MLNLFFKITRVKLLCFYELSKYRGSFQMKCLCYAHAKALGKIGGNNQ